MGVLCAANKKLDAANRNIRLLTYITRSFDQFDLPNLNA